MKPYWQKLTYNSSILNSSLDFQNPKTYLPLQTHRDPTFHLGQYHSIPTPTNQKQNIGIFARTVVFAYLQPH